MKTSVLAIILAIFHFVIPQSAVAKFQVDRLGYGRGDYGTTTTEISDLRSLLDRIARQTLVHFDSDDDLEYFLNSPVSGAGLPEGTTVHTILSLMVLAGKANDPPAFAEVVQYYHSRGYDDIFDLLTHLAPAGVSTQGDPLTTTAEDIENAFKVVGHYPGLPNATDIFMLFAKLQTVTDILEKCTPARLASDVVNKVVIATVVKVLDDYDQGRVPEQIAAYKSLSLQGQILRRADGTRECTDGVMSFASNGWLTPISSGFYPTYPSSPGFWDHVDFMLWLEPSFGNATFQTKFGAYLTQMGSSGNTAPGFSDIGGTVSVDDTSNTWWTTRGQNVGARVRFGETYYSRCKRLQVRLQPEAGGEAATVIQVPDPVDAAMEAQIVVPAIGSGQASEHYTLTVTLTYDRLNGEGDIIGEFSKPLIVPVSLVTNGTRTPSITSNLKPQAHPVSVQCAKGGTVCIPLIAHDPDGLVAERRVIGLPASSVVTDGNRLLWRNYFQEVGPGGEFVVYRHNGNVGSLDIFTFAAVDDQGEMGATAEVRIAIVDAPSNPPILTQPQILEVESGKTISVELTGGSTVSGATVTRTVTVPPAAGQITPVVEGNGTHLTYTAPATASQQTLTYRVQDGAGNQKTENITIKVVPPVAHAPVASNLAASVAPGKSVSIQLKATDADGGNLTYQVIANPSRGSISGTAPNLTYTHNPANGLAPDRFEFKVTDPTGRIDTAFVNIHIVNSAPVIGPLDNVAADVGQPVSVTLSATDAAGQVLSFHLASGSPGTINAQNRWTHEFSTPASYTVTILVRDRATAGSPVLSEARRSFTVVVGGYAEFTDVPPSHPQYTLVHDAAHTRGVVGYTEGTSLVFRPDQAVTRGEFMTMLFKYSGIPADTSGTPFPDVPATHTHFQAIQTFKNRSVVVGYHDGDFGPDNYLTRQEMAIIFTGIMRWGRRDFPVAPFLDVPVPPPSGMTSFQWKPIYNAICQLKEHGLTSSENLNYRPSENATRLEAVIMLSRFLELLAVGPPGDGILGSLSYTDNGTSVTITKCDTSATGALEIPESINGKPVASIGDSAFNSCWRLTSVTIPASVTSIGSVAFANCSGLTSVTIPSSVTGIGSHAFASCSGLTVITVATGNPNYSSLDGVLFNKLKTTLIKFPEGRSGAYAIPSSVMNIEAQAFNGCGLTSVTIPSSVTSIGSHAFASCRSLTSVTIPSSVTSIGSQAFAGYSGLTEISVASGNPNYSSLDGVLFNKSKTILIQFPRGKAGVYVIPSSVTSIGSFAFEWCNGLTSVTIPSSVTSIGYQAFSVCYGLTSVTIPSSVTSIGDLAFSSCSKLTEITVDTGNPNYSSLDGVLFNKLKTTLIKFPQGRSGAYAIPSSVMTIEAQAFNGCGLTSVTIPSSVTSIGSYAFMGCHSLLGAVFLGNAPSLESLVFASNASGFAAYYDSANTGFTSPIWQGYPAVAGFPEAPLATTGNASNVSDVSATLSGTVNPNGFGTTARFEFGPTTAYGTMVSVALDPSNGTAGQNVTTNIGGLAIGQTYHYRLVAANAGGIATGEDRTFTTEQSSGDFKFTLANGAATITGYTGTGGAVVIPETIGGMPVVGIGASVFQSQTNITSVIIPNGVTSIGDSAFANCFDLASVIIPNSVSSIGSLAFYHCEKLGRINLPAGVTMIGDHAFTACYLLTLDSETLPAGITRIAMGTFNSCRSLTRITIPNGVISIDYAAFGDCRNLISVDIPSSVTGISDTAFASCTSLAELFVNESNSIYRGIDGVLFSEDMTTLLQYPSAKSGDYLIPTGVVNIKESAFSECMNLTAVTFPTSVTSIKRNAFYNCINLMIVTIPASVSSIGDYSFYGCYNLAGAVFNGDAPSMGENVFHNTTSGFTIYYDSANAGFTSPIWQGYPAVAGLPVAPVASTGKAGNVAGTSASLSGTVNANGFASTAYFEYGPITSYGSKVPVTLNPTNGTVAQGVSASIYGLGTGETYHYRLVAANAGGIATGEDQTFTTEQSSGDFKFTLANGAATITGYTGTGGAVVIPETIGGMPVVGIGASVFQSQTSITSVIIPSGVTSIGSGAFSNCYGLTSVTIPSSGTSIGSSAFYNCYSLTAVTIPLSVTSIGEYAFAYCSSLTIAPIPALVTSIGSHAFYGCYRLIGAVFSGSAPSMGTDVFTATSSDFTVYYDSANTGFSSPTWLGYPSVGAYPVAPGVVTGNAAGVAASSASLSGTVNPNGFTSTAYFEYGPTTAYGNRLPLTLDPANGTTTQNVSYSIGGLVAGQTYHYRLVATNAGGTATGEDQTFTTEQTAGDYKYTLANGMVTITGYTGPGGAVAIPEAIGGMPVVGIGASVFQSQTSITSVIIPSGVTSIGSGAFSNCYGLTSVTIPSSVTSIGSSAFYACYSLTDVAIPSLVTSIGYSAFYGCIGVTDLDLPSSLTSIGISAFSYCSGLTNVTIPALVTSIGSHAFYGCNRLIGALFSGNAPSMETDVFSNTASGFTIYYDNANAGFTSPTWLGYPSVAGFPVAPIVATGNAAGVTASSASLSGTVNPNGFASTAYFEYGPTNAYGSTVPVTLDPPNGTTVQNVSGSIGGLLTGQTYHYRLVAANPGGTATGEDQTFTTEQTAGDYKYTVANNTVTITGYTGPGGAVAIPEAIGGMPVVGIGPYAFQSQTSITSVIIPNGVRSIGYGSFSNCYSLGSVAFPESLTSIGVTAFGYCSALTSVTLPSSVTSIGSQAFSLCSGLTEITVDSSNPNYSATGGVLFNKDKTILIQFPGGKSGSYAIPSAVTSIGEWAFAYCGGLSSVTVPSSVSSIGSHAFYDCYRLIGVLFSGSAPSMGTDVFTATSSDFTVYYDSANTGFTSPTWLGYPSVAGFPVAPIVATGNAAGVTASSASLSGTVNPNGFASTAYFEYGPTDAYGSTVPVTLDPPNGSTTQNVSGSIGGLLTGQTYHYRLVAANPGGTATGADQTFTTEQTAGEYKYTVANNTVTITGYTGPGGAVAIPEAIGGMPVVGIGPYAFQSQTSITSVIIPNGVRSIGYGSFSNCYSLGSVAFPESLTSIGVTAFGYCSALTSVTLPSSVTSIESYAFFGCGGLTYVTIPSSVTSIGSQAFSLCGGLTEITVDSSNPNYSATGGVLFNKDKTILIQFPGGKSGSYAIPSAVTTIGEWAFAYCYGLTSVMIPSSVTRIGSYAFYGCAGLASIEIPKSVTSIESHAFYRAYSLISANFLGDAPSMGADVFAEAASGFTVYYDVSKSGFALPSWHDYRTNGVIVSSSMAAGVTGEIATGKEYAYRVTLPGPGILIAWSEGATDTFGSLLSSGGAVLDEDNDSDRQANFRASTVVAAGDYFIRVKGGAADTAGGYRLRTRFIPASEPIQVSFLEKDGQDVNLGFTNTAGVLYDIQSSDDLQTWATIQRVTGGGAETLLELAGRGYFPKGFFRVGTVQPAPLGGLVGTPGNAQVVLSWAAAEGATGYQVKRSLTSGSGYETIQTLSGTTFTDETAVNGTTYYYIVTAINGPEAGTDSAEIAVRPMGSAPTFSPPSGFYASAFSVTITADEGATISYTTDGSDPTNSPTRISGASQVTGITIPAGAARTLKACAFRNGLLSNPVATVLYNTAVWTNPAGDSWPVAGNWLGGQVGTGTNVLADFSTLDLAADTTVTLDGPRTIGGLRFGDTSASHNWALHTGSDGPLTLATSTGNPVLHVANQVTTTIGAVLAGTQGFNKTGAGTLTITAAGTWTGGTTVSEGTLEVQAKSGDVGYTVMPGTMLKLGYSSADEYKSKWITINGSGVSDPSGLYLKRGINYRTSDGILLQSAPTSLRAYGTGEPPMISGFDVQLPYFLRSVAAASGSVVGADVNVSTGGYGYKIQADAGANTATGDIVIEGVISGTGGSNVSGTTTQVGLRKIGNGSVKLTNANTLTGSTGILAGSIILAGGDNRLPLDSVLELGNGTSIGKLVLGDGSGPSNQTFSNIVTTGNPSNAVVGGSAAVSRLTLNMSNDMTFPGRLGMSGGNGNNVALAKSGFGTLTMSQSNTFIGDVTIHQGILKATRSSALGTAAKTLTCQSGDGTLALSSTSTGVSLPASIRCVTSGPAIVNSAGNNTILGEILLSQGIGDTTVQSLAGSLILAGRITCESQARTLVLSGTSAGANRVTGEIADGPLPTSVAKTGTGTWELASASNHTGTTMVSGGKLILSGSLRSPLAVTGGTLEIKGSPATTAGMTMQGGGSLAAQAGEFLRVGGDVTLAGRLLVVSEAPFTDGTGVMVIEKTSEGPVAGTFDGLPEGGLYRDSSSHNWQISYTGGDGNDVTLVAANSIEFWRSTYFGGSQATGDAADDANPDGDGWTNLEEFQNGTHPLQADAPVVSISSPTAEPVTLASVDDILHVAASAPMGSGVSPVWAWSVLSGPEGAMFESTGAATATIVFPSAGTYVVQAAASSGSGAGIATRTATRTVIVAPPASLSLRQGENGYEHGATFIRGDGSNTAWNAGGRDQLLVGRTTGNLRMLFSFRLPSLPSGFTPQSANLRLWQAAQPGSAGTNGTTYLSNINLYPLHLTPTEGTGVSTSATDAETISGANWTRRTDAAGAGNWKYPGGRSGDATVADYAPTLLARIVSNIPTALNTGVMSVSQPAFIEAVRAAYAAGKPLDMIAIAEDTETSGATNVFARFHSDDASEEHASMRPRLLIGFSANALPVIDCGEVPWAAAGIPEYLAGSAGGASGIVWSLVSGPGQVEFSDPGAAATQATFSAAGTYSLRLQASNSYGSVSRFLSVNVANPPEAATFAGWQQETWPGLPLSAEMAPDQDPDGDGVINLLEWAMHRNAKSPDSPEQRLAQSAIPGKLDFSYTRRKTLAGQASFIVEWSDTLGNDWSTEGVGAELRSPLDATSESVTVTVPASSMGRRFVRVKVVRP